MVDIGKAPRDADGLVRFEADFMILRPMDGGNRRVFFDYGNRGHKRALQFFNDAPHSNDPVTLDHAGNGFLMRRGYAVAWLAWEGDILPGDGRMVLDVPVATDDGQPITGRVRTEIIVDQRWGASMPLSGRVAAHSYPVADRQDAVLTRRRYPYDPPETIAATDWDFALELAGAGAESAAPEQAVVPADNFIHYPAWVRARLDIRTDIHGKGPKGHGAGACCRARLREFPEIRQQPDEPVGWDADGLRLGTFADRPLPARLRLSRL